MLKYRKNDDDGTLKEKFSRLNIHSISKKSKRVTSHLKILTRGEPQVLTHPTADLHWQLQFCFCMRCFSKRVGNGVCGAAFFSCLIYKVIFWLSQKTGKIFVIEIENNVMCSPPFPFLHKFLKLLVFSREEVNGGFVNLSLKSAFCRYPGNNYCLGLRTHSVHLSHVVALRFGIHQGR